MIDKQKLAAGFCGVCWHETKYNCITDMFECLHCHKVFTRENPSPDFSDKDFYLLHSAMTEKGEWGGLYYFLANKWANSTFRDYRKAAIKLHQLPFPEQFEIIVEYLAKEDA